MKPRYVLTQEARKNLAAIAEHVRTESSERAAEKVVLDLQRAFRLLAENPGIGHVREDLTSNTAVRVWAVLSYLVVFKPDETPLAVIAIAHGARNPKTIAEELRRSSKPRNDEQ